MSLTNVKRLEICIVVRSKNINMTAGRNSKAHLANATDVKTNYLQAAYRPEMTEP